MATTTLENMRAEFKKLARNATYAVAYDIWFAAVKALLVKRGIEPDKASAEEWLAAAKDAETRCAICKGTGRYCWGACVNGVMSKSGPCYRCNSKGTQGQADYRRNFGYDNHRRVI